MIDYTHLLNVPYRWGGRDPSTGLDCWGLVRALLPCVPDYDTPASEPLVWRSVCRALGDWQRVERIDTGDVILMGMGSRPHHVGVAVTTRQVLHTTKTDGAMVTPIALLRQTYPLIRGYRWAG